MRDIYLLIAPGGQWYRYWPDFSPVLLSAPLGLEEPFADLDALVAVTPRLKQPRPEGESFTSARVLICAECEGKGEVLDEDAAPSWETDEQGNSHLEPAPAGMMRACSSCNGDGILRVAWTKGVPASQFFLKHYEKE